MPDTTIDTLTIKVQGDGQSAVETLDKVAKALEKIKSVSSGGGGNATLKRLDSIKQSINGINVDGVSKLNALFETLKNMGKVNIPAKIADRITTIGKSVRSLKGIDFTQLNRMADGLRALRDVQDVKIPNLNTNNQSSDRQMIDNLARDVENARQRARGNAGANLNGTVETPVQETTVKASKGVSSITEKIKSAYHGFQDWQKSLQSGNEWINKIGKGVSPITSRVKAAGAAIKESFSGSIISGFIGKLNEGFRALKRIAMYRLFRTTIKEITEGFKTGINDMYQYSKATNGEFAQTLDNLASSSLTYKNSLGAIMAPIINLVVPWIDKLLNKLVDVNNYIAMIIAGLSGKSTFSKAVRVTTEYAEAANKASKNTNKVKDKIGQVKDKVDELKRSLAGLDEITIIGEQDVSPVSNSGNINGVNSNPLDNGTAAGLDYKNMFVEAPVDMAKVNEFKKKLEQILDIAKWIGLAILGWKLATFISSIGEALTGLGLLKSQMIGLTLMIVGFGIEFASGFKIGKGTADMWDYIKFAIGSALGIVGTALVFGLNNPAGWIIGITAALVVGIASISVGLKARLSEVIEQAFYDGGGTITISDLADQFERLMQDIINVNQPIIDAGKRINETMDTQVKPAITTIEGISRGIELGAYTAEEKIPELTTQFEKLRDGTKTVLDEVYNNIIRAVAGSLSAALADAGADVPQIVALLAEIKGETDATFDDINKKFQEAKTQYDNGSLSADNYAQTILGLTEQMKDLVGATDPVKDSFAGVEDALKDIDWQKKDAKDIAFSKVNDSATAATQAVEDAYKKIQSNLEVMRGWSDSADYQLKLDQLVVANETTRKQQLENISKYTAGFYKQIQDDMLLEMQKISEQLGKEYEKLNPIQKFFTGSKDAYINNGLKQYREEVINPVTEEIKSLYQKLGIDGQAYASEAASEIISGLFTEQIHAGYYNVFRSSTSYEDAVRNAYQKVGQALPDGIVEGINKNKQPAVSASGKLSDDLLHIVTDKKHLDTHSPSKATEKIMKDTIMGFVVGTNKNKGLAINSLNSFLKEMLSRLEIFTNRWRDSINAMFSDMAHSWQNADFKSDGSYSYSRLNMRNVQKFAEGGFPEDGLFFANHNELVGQFSNGKTAVANNGQIVEGISQGVESANEEQNSLLREQNRLLRMLLEKRSTIDVTTITNAMSRKNQRDGKVTVPIAT